MQAWTAEDRTYAIATALASLVVALLVASNFGLVGSPLTRFAETPPVSVGAGPDVPAAPAPQPVPSQPVQLFPAPPSQPGPAPLRPVPPPAQPVDRTPPSSAITTPDGAVLAPGSGAVVNGVASDGDAGVSRVVVTFSSPNGVVPVDARLACSDASNRSCTWTASVPGEVGTYQFSPRAHDRAGNVEPDPRPTRTVTVVAASLGSGGSSTGLVERTTDALGGLVRTVGSLLGL